MENTEKDEIPKMDRHHFSGSVTSFLGCNHPESDRILGIEQQKKLPRKHQICAMILLQRSLKKITIVPFSK